MKGSFVGSKMENKAAEGYYQELARAYDHEFQAWVPQAQDMVNTLVNLVRLKNPDSMLDIGPGTSYIERRLMEELPNMHLDLVEASEPMFQRTKQVMQPYGDRVRVFPVELKDYEPDTTYDAVFTNLVLHNIGKHTEGKQTRDKKKIEQLERIHSWLNTGSVLIWGDLIKYEDPQLMDYLYDFRVSIARERGTREEFVAENVKKERTQDNPWTIEETLDNARLAGFSSAHNVWTHDTFGIFYLRK